jgi:hypothetical protein
MLLLNRCFHFVLSIIIDDVAVVEEYAFVDDTLFVNIEDIFVVFLLDLPLRILWDIGTGEDTVL